MHIARTATLITILGALSAPALADEGKVVWNDPSCMYFMLQLADGYGSYNVREGALPDEGDVIEGGLTSEGTQKLTNKTAAKSLTAIPMALAPKLRALVYSSPAQCYRRFTNKPVKD